MAIHAGIDMSMVATDYSFPELLLDLVQSGEVTEERIDISVKRILALKV
jgi:beta-glucosidase